jgi:hypothetical protein
MLCEGSSICYPEATDSVPWVEGLTPLEASHFLPSVVFNCRPLWPVAAKPKGLLLARVITWLSLPNPRVCLTGEVECRVMEEGVT